MILVNPSADIVGISFFFPFLFLFVANLLYRPWGAVHRVERAFVPRVRFWMVYEALLRKRTAVGVHPFGSMLPYQYAAKERRHRNGQATHRYMFRMASLHNRRLCVTKTNCVRWSCESCAVEEPNIDEPPLSNATSHSGNIPTQGTLFSQAFRIIS